MPSDQLDAEVDELAAQIVANSGASLVAYKDLYAKADELGVDAGLAYEYGTHYSIPDTAERLASFR